MKDSLASGQIQRTFRDRYFIVLVVLLGITLTGFAQTDLKHQVDSLFTAGEFEQVELLIGPY